jgi:methylmalonyl-CoA/ethylmalonyl-CoA epimerase
MFTSINHVGMAVPSIQKFLDETQMVYGAFQRGPIITNHRQRVREMFLTDGRTVIELLEPMGDPSPLAGFLGRNPHGGLIHIAFDVDALEPALAQIRDLGGMPIGEPVPDVAFDERRIAFAMIAGQVIELIERGQE